MDIRRFSRAVLTQSLLLPLQFLLGMAINLFIQIPDPVISGFFASARGVLVIIHVINGLAIVTLATLIIIFSGKFKNALPSRLSVAAAVFVILAIASGVTFVFFSQIDIFSYTMSIGFVTAAVLYSFVGRAAMQSTKQ